MTGRMKFPVVVVLMLFVIPSLAALTQTEVENFGLQCWPTENDYNLQVKFAPVIKLVESSKTEGQWSYEFSNADQQYSNNNIQLPREAAARIDLVMQLNPSDSGMGEGYLWNVIAAPKVTGWKYGGHWATTRPITNYRRLADKRDSLIAMATLSRHNRQPVHSTIESGDVDNAETLNKAWGDVFGRKIVNLIYAASNSGSSNQTDYSLTFYYVPTPALRYINEDGYKWPSFKHVDKPGKVFGFVLTPEGECLAQTSLDVVRD